ncbi:hypothetical protein ACQ4PT_005410 [Festuca glaucescens]
MDVLAAMFRAAERAGVLDDLSTDGLRHRVFLYADDIVVFARPDEREIQVVKEDPWLGGLSVAAVAPAVLALVRPALIKRRKVSEGLPNNEWVNDIAGELSVDTVVQFFKLWDAVSRISLGKSADSFTWKWTADGSFSSRSAYRGFFHGTTALPGSAQVWNSFAPYKFKFHAWLALRGRCWTADRRLCHGLPSHTLPAVFGGG